MNSQGGVQFFQWRGKSWGVGGPLFIELLSVLSGVCVSFDRGAGLCIIVSVDHGLNRCGSPRFLGKNYHTPPNISKLRSQ